MHLPAPHKLGENCTRWSLSELLDAEAKRAGVQQPPLDPEHERYLTVKQVAERYACAINTIWRWCREATQ